MQNHLLTQQPTNRGKKYFSPFQRLFHLLKLYVCFFFFKYMKWNVDVNITLQLLKRNHIHSGVYKETEKSVKL